MVEKDMIKSVSTIDVIEMCSRHTMILSKGDHQSFKLSAEYQFSK